VYPALAVVAALGERAEVLWVGGEGGMEAALVERAGIPFTSIPAAGIHGVGLRRAPGNAMQLMRGWRAARSLIQEFQPDVLFFTGGYVAVPVAFAGGDTRTACFVPDLEPALALQIISRRADIIAITTDESRKYYKQGKNIVVSGYPTRYDVENVNREDARKALDLQDGVPVILVFGGSRGARSINEALWNVLTEVLELAQVLHITGELDWPETAARQEKLPADLAHRYHPYAYLHEEMAFALAAADLAVSRAGAATMGEFPLFGLPAVLVPYPHAWRYQKTNAAYLEAEGAAVVLEDAALFEKLLPMLQGLLTDDVRLQAMSAASRSLARPDAAEIIANELINLTHGPGGESD
jgi:UDP-N-acetylglucosamine--N-acetylmuramyl-(pentapeptide) pyrophosphoryl-undecaprenol N-acetylglucosamine transferase